MLGEVLQQCLVLSGGQAVPDALGAEHLHGIPHRLRTGRLARVRQAGQAQRPGPREHVGELRSGTPISGPPSPKPTEPSGAHRSTQSMVRSPDSSPSSPWDVIDPAHHQSVLLPGTFPGSRERLGQRVRRDALQQWLSGVTVSST
jgi:hypothetical protein